VQGTRDRILEFEASTADARAAMGDRLPAPEKDKVHFLLRVADCEGAYVELIEDGKLQRQSELQENLEGKNITRSFDWNSDGSRHYFRIAVRTQTGAALLISNPIYINHV
jgi:hypothetical protein